VTLLKKLAATPLILFGAAVFAANPQLLLLNDPEDVSGEFRDSSNIYCLADQLPGFDPATHMGKIIFRRSQFSLRHALNNDIALNTAAKPNEFPGSEYAANPSLPFSKEFVSLKTFRVRLTSCPQTHLNSEDLMLAGDVSQDNSWKYEEVAGGHRPPRRQPMVSRRAHRQQRTWHRDETVFSRSRLLDAPTLETCSWQRDRRGIPAHRTASRNGGG